MKKLILALMVFAVSGVSYAFCPQNVDRIYARMQANQVNSVVVSYSADEEAWESKIKSGLESKGAKVSAVKVDGTGVCKIRRAN